MMAIAGNPFGRINTYLEKVASIPVLPFISQRFRREARRERRLREKLLKTLRTFLQESSEYLQISHHFLEVVEMARLEDLLECESVAREAMKMVVLRERQVLGIGNTIDSPLVSQVLSVVLELKLVTARIQRSCRRSISEHLEDDALERGFIRISDLNSGLYGLDFNFKIDLSIEEGEIRGEIPELDLIEYGETLESVLKGIREYLTDLYEGIAKCSPSELAGDLIKQREILKDWIYKK